MKTLIALLIVLVAGFFIASYMTNHNINPLAEVKGISNKIDALNAMTPQQIANTLSGGISGKAGNDFDAAYLKGMIADQQGAIAMSKAAIVASNRPEIKQMAQEILNTQTKQLSQMQSWQTQWFPPNTNTTQK